MKLPTILKDIIGFPQRRLYDSSDVELAPAYTAFKKLSESQQIADRKDTNKKTYTRDEYIADKDGIQQKYRDNPRQFDIKGVDSPDPPISVGGKLRLFHGNHLKNIQFTPDSIIIKPGFTTKYTKVQGSGFTPRADVMTTFGSEVVMIVNVDNDKRKYNQKFRPMPYGDMKKYPEYARKVSDAKSAETDNELIMALTGFHDEREWNTRKPTILKPSEVEQLFIDYNAATHKTGKIPAIWKDKIKIVTPQNIGARLNTNEAAKKQYKLETTKRLDNPKIYGMKKAK